MQSRREPRYLLKQAPSPLDMMASLVAIIGALGIATLLFSGIELLSEHNAWFAKILEEYKSLSESLVSNQHVFLSILSTVILVPIAEELLFRGIIFSELKRAMPASVAIVLCAFLFALFHFNYVQSSYVFFAGLIITMIYYWTASIGIAIFMHIAYNFFGGGLSLFIADESLVNTILFWAELICVPLLFVALAIVFLRHRFDPPRSSRRLAFPFQGDATFFENEAQIINSKSGTGSFEELVDARIEGSDESRYKRFHF